MPRDYQQILADQKEERDLLPLASYCRRRKQSSLDLSSPLVQVVTGMRRSGKTTLCHQAFHAAGVPYAYINFDDEQLATLATDQLNDLLLAAYLVYGDFTHLFLDEIQNVQGWELFVNRLLRRGLHIVLTGSNSHLLSQELGTHLTGRYQEIELLPMSFAEYLEFAKIDAENPSTLAQAKRLEAYQTYSRQGGLPECYQLNDRRNYLKTLYNAILFKDVAKRYNIRYPKTLAQLASVLLNNFCREVNYMELSKALAVKGNHTLQNYASYLERAFLIRMLPRFSFKPTRRQQSEKAYAVDLGIVSNFTGLTENDDNLGWRLENLVFLKLYDHRESGDYEVYYWKNGCEVDFVLVRKQRVIQLVQVAYDISAPKTRLREINGLLKAANQLKCDNLLLVNSKEKSTLAEGERTIHILPAVEYLLKKDPISL